MAYHPLRNALVGAAAGAVGTGALNVATYIDMTVRGRPSSDVPTKVVSAIAERIGIDFTTGTAGPDSQQAQSRKSGAGALMGYATGLGIGTAYGLVRAWRRPVRGATPIPLVGLVLGLAAMAGSDVPATITGATNPKTWGMSGWLSDLLPHLAYGLATALTFETLTSS